MKIKTLLITAIGAFAIANVNAGDGKIVEEVMIVEETNASIAVGYNTSYIFRGVNYGDNQVTAQIDYDIPNTPLAIGAWYGNPTQGRGLNPAQTDELDLYATVSHSFGSVEAWLGYTAYLFPETGGGRLGNSSTNEVGTGIVTSAGPIDLAVSAYYDFNIEGWYVDATAGHSFDISDIVSLELSAGISYQNDYFSAGGDFNSVLVVAALPIALTDTATLRPYVAGNFALSAIDSFQDDQIFGGISLSVAF
ncbi:MAG: hypothetical protein GXP30_12850 [Verrucomicrobia bacterium]|nr:hypothetical protein [Verrucomicrobiota bacterium]